MILVSDAGLASEAYRPKFVYWSLMTISMMFVVVGICILLFSEIPQFNQFLWATGLGLAAALLASDNSKPRVPAAARRIN